MMIFAKILDNIKYKFSQKETDGLKVEGYKDDILNVDHIQHFGFRSKPPKNTTAIVKYLSKNGRNRVAIASKNYNINIVFLDGETIMFAVDSNLEVKAKIYLKNDGVINLETENSVNIKSNNVNIGEGGNAIARKDDFVEGKIIIPSGSSSGTYDLIDGKISTGSSKHTAS